METIKVKIVWKNNYGAVSDQVPGCVATHKTLDGVKEAYESALKFHIEGSEPDELPDCVKGEYKIEFVLEVSALLHYYDGILTRAALSRVTGINQRQLGHYICGRSKPRKPQSDRIVSA